jgi:uncharacterized protein YbjT (DUF2867 family)
MPIDISAPPVFLLTAIAPRKREGSSPTGIVGRHLARQLLDKGASVRILAEQEQLEGWPQETQVICGSIANRGDAATALVGVDRVFLACK